MMASHSGCLVSALAAIPSQPKLSGVALYDYLYATGYHNKTTGSRAIDLFPTLQNLTKSEGLASVLDIGCSHGYAVNWLWSLGVRASLRVSGVASGSRSRFGCGAVQGWGGAVGALLPSGANSESTET